MVIFWTIEIRASRVLLKLSMPTLPDVSTTKTRSIEDLSHENAVVVVAAGVVVVGADVVVSSEDPEQQQRLLWCLW